MTRAGPGTRLDMSLKAELSSVREAREAVAEAAFELGMPQRVIADMRLCVSEAVSNVVRHAYVDEVGEVQVTFDPLQPGALVVVRDFGSGSAPLRTIRPREESDEGGLGWKLIRSLADRCSLRSTPEDGTEVWMSFGTGSSAAAHG